MDGERVSDPTLEEILVELDEHSNLIKLTSNPANLDQHNAKVEEWIHSIKGKIQSLHRNLREKREDTVPECSVATI